MTTCKQCGTETEEASGLCAGCQLLDALPDELAARKSIAGIPMQDMKSVEETQRIKQIADHLRNAPGRKVAVMVDHGPGYEGKGDRYIRLISEQLPGVTVVSRSLGPVKGGETIILRYR